MQCQFSLPSTLPAAQPRHLRDFCPHAGKLDRQLTSQVPPLPSVSRTFQSADPWKPALSHLRSPHLHSILKAPAVFRGGDRGVQGRHNQGSTALQPALREMSCLHSAGTQHFLLQYIPGQLSYRPLLPPSHFPGFSSPRQPLG